MHELNLRAMNTDIRLLAADSGDRTQARLTRAAERFAVHERALSRFDPASDLSALNRAGPGWTWVPELLFHALTAADALFRQTGGLYNPGILSALEAEGYDRSFEQLAPPLDDHVRRPAVPPAPPIAVLFAKSYALDPERQAVRLAPGVRLDLGGIGKGLAVDAAAAELGDQRGFLVDAGGDIRVGGTSPDGGDWGIAVQDPTDLDRDLAVLAVRDGAVATSSVGRRRWLRQGEVVHHLIDPRTGRSAVSDLLAATVLAPACATAEVFAKAVVIAGAEAGFALLERHNLAGLVVDRERRLRVNPAMQPFLVDTSA
ncbi:MAG TPA: FAD:protein FMN transferase [Dehalococcoidia bacterium]|nr:FAD:protein FMN transferase [Dehalococcoidia bacterium]